MSMEKEEPPRRKVSCTTCFDALWFCYSPVHQLQQYYRVGSLDNCSGKWNALIDCLKLKTKGSLEAHEILEKREKEQSKSHIWTFRTPEEAAIHWDDTFGHLDEYKKATYKSSNRTQSPNKRAQHQRGKPAQTNTN